MTVGRICQRQVDTAEGGEPARVVARRMSARNVGTLVVLDADTRPVGIVTDRDLVVRVLAEGLDPATAPVADFMTAHPSTIHEDAPIEDALVMMRVRSARRLPVVDGHGHLAGLISIDDVLALLAEEFRDVGKLLDKSSPRSLSQV